MMNLFTLLFYPIRYSIVLRKFTYSKWAIILFISLSILFKPTTVSAQPDGAKIFKQNCSACHTVTDAKLVGPGLKGITTKRKEGWLLKWIKDSPALIKSGDADAKAIFDQFGQMPMPPQSLSDEEIKAVLTYISAGESAPPAQATQTGKTDVSPTSTSSPISDNTLIYILIGVIIFLAFVIYALRKATKAMKISGGLSESFASRDSGEMVWAWMSGNKKIVAFIVLIILFLGMRSCWNGLMGIGISQGYAPEQPIKYSHKIHAGQNGIDCQYCHSGASRGKTAGIPSANVCMNCHKYIQQGTVTGKEEIAKIYKALDYDPETQKYGNNPTPIKWVRVHNLPDLAYFNHSQHVKVGKIVCQQCHGQVQEMDVVQQYAPLTMGWCINCHRTTEVKMEGNVYYKDLHAKLAEKYKGQKITVDKIGGLDCAKCHY